MFDWILLGFFAGFDVGLFFSIVIGWSVYSVETDDRLSESSVFMVLAVAEANDLMSKSGEPFEPIEYPKKRSRGDVWRDVWSAVWPIMTTCVFCGVLVGSAWGTALKSEERANAETTIEATIGGVEQ